jgi:hypothetical protein
VTSTTVPPDGLGKIGSDDFRLNYCEGLSDVHQVSHVVYFDETVGQSFERDEDHWADISVRALKGTVHFHVKATRALHAWTEYANVDVPAGYFARVLFIAFGVFTSTVRTSVSGVTTGDEYDLCSQWGTDKPYERPPLDPDGCPPNQHCCEHAGSTCSICKPDGAPCP